MLSKAISGSALMTGGASVLRYIKLLCYERADIFSKREFYGVTPHCLTGRLSEEQAAGRSCCVDTRYG